LHALDQEGIDISMDQYYVCPQPGKVGSIASVHNQGAIVKLISFASWPIWAIVVVLLMAAAMIGFAGARMTRVADRLADARGLGEALFGAVLLGGSTSPPPSSSHGPL
jgi:hypothetical protein